MPRLEDMRFERKRHSSKRPGAETIGKHEPASEFKACDGHGGGLVEAIARDLAEDDGEWWRGDGDPLVAEVYRREAKVLVALIAAGFHPVGAFMGSLRFAICPTCGIEFHSITNMQCPCRGLVFP